MKITVDFIPVQLKILTPEDYEKIEEYTKIITRNIEGLFKKHKVLPSIGDGIFVDLGDSYKSPSIGPASYSP